MARWIRLVKAHPTMASSWRTSIVLKYRTGDIGIPGDPRLLTGDPRFWKPGGYIHHPVNIAPTLSNHIKEMHRAATGENRNSNENPI